LHGGASGQNAVNQEANRHDALKVLLVEDSAELQKLLRAMLNEIPDVEVIAMVDGEAEAVRWVQSAGADLAIVDLELQDGSGLGFLKKTDPGLSSTGLKVVVFSNYSNLVIRHRCLSLGAHAFFDKSFQIDELLSFVQQEASTRN
jgi:DNA-binding NarL/FixJ family response regulator